jgi:uncharacterized repeat protein (TIGR01451 family)/uncharacterized delta-60 repeat protein
MFTLHDKVLKRVGGLFMPLWLAMAFCAGTAMDVHAQPAPPNDNLANAQTIIGSTGTVSGTNLNATLEGLEFSPNFAGASIWYAWTAPYTTTMDFNTLNSIDPFTGNELDTVLVVYKLSGTNVAYANLTQLAANDDDPSGGLTSRVDVPVTVGNIYLIQVLGSPNNPTGPYPFAEGDVTLNWSPSLVGGTFGFSVSSPFAFFAGEFDDYLPFNMNYTPNSVAQSLANKAGTNNVRVTVTRQGGFTGKCEVTLTVTNSMYTNYLITNVIQTNIFTSSTSSNGTFLAQTNTFSTLIASENLIEEAIDIEGVLEFVYQPQWTVILVTQTNYEIGSNPTVVGPVVVNCLPLAGLGLTNFFTNWPCDNFEAQSLATNNAIITTTITDVLCTGPETNISLTSSATNGVDYVGIITNLTFNDFQMSQDVYLQINPHGTYNLLPGPDWPDAYGNYTLYGINSLLSMSLSKASNAPGENLDITPPTLSTSSSTAYLDILNYWGIPDNYINSPDPLVAATSFSCTDGVLGAPNYVTINLERATFRCNRIPDGSGGTYGTNAFLYAILTGNPPVDASYTVHYTIDCAGFDYAGVIGTPIEAFNWNRFPTVAGSDYAVPSFFTNEGVTFPDFGLPVNTPPDPSTQDVGKNTTWPAGTPYIGSFTIGPFNPGEPYGEIAIPILTNGAVEFDVDMDVELFETTGDASANASATVPGFIGNLASAKLTIDFTGQPGGAYDTNFNLDDVPMSSPPNNTVPGANGGVTGSVNAIAIQANGQAVIGGFFLSYDDTAVYSLARLLTNGFLDTSFNNVNEPGVGYEGIVNAIVIDSSGRIIIGGSFSSYDGLPNTLVNNIARLNYNGSLDTTFNSGIGFNSFVKTLAIDAHGNILVGGDFTSYNTTNCNHIARLLPGGGLDPTFLPNTGNGLPNYGTDQDVESVAIDGSGKIILGGEFSLVNGSTNYYLARLLTNGAVDPSFIPEIGPDDAVYSVAIETNNNNEILIGGAFQNYNLASRNSIALIQNNGSLDTAFVPGAGADGAVYSVVIQPANGDVLIGGQFRNYNTSRRLGVARLLPSGWLDTSFMDTAYNQYAGLINKAYSDPVNIAYALALQPDGNILVGGSFTNVGGGAKRDSIHNQINITRLIGAPTAGPQTSGGGIGNCPGNITLTQNPYSVVDTAGKLFVTLERTNGSLGPAQVTLGTNLLAPGPGAATAADLGLILPSMPLYNDIYNVYGNILPFGVYGWRVSDGFYGYNNNVQPLSDLGASTLNLNIYDDTAAQQNLSAVLSLLNVNDLNINNPSDALVLGGVLIPLYPAVGLPSATLDILNNNLSPGFVGFSATNYTAVDTSNSVTITVLRTNGSSGTLYVYYYTANGTAQSGVNYTGTPYSVSPSSKAELTFNGNSATFTIPIIQQSSVQNTKTFHLSLYDPDPSGILSPQILPTNATVTIIDGNFAPGHLSFSSPTYTETFKGGLATVSVERLGGAQYGLTVQCGTSNGTAVNGINYTGVTNTLTWSNQDASVKTMTVQTLQDNIVEGTKTVNLNLFNAAVVGESTNNSLILAGQTTNAVLTIDDSDSYGVVSFVAPNFNILQNAGQALITVTRSTGTTGTILVNYTNYSDTNASSLGPLYQPAQAGTNFVVTSGTLTFGPGVTSQSFIVPIIYTPNETNAANRMVVLELVSGSPTNISGQFPQYATLTILDPQLVSYPPGSVDQTTLDGTGFNNDVDALALQPDGSVLAGGDFTFVNQYPFEYVARLFPNGAFDSSFLLSQAGANGSVLQVLSQTTNNSQTNDGPIVIAGNFTQVDGVNRGGIARLNLDGSIDETFNPGDGADSTIFAVAETSFINQPSTIAYYIGGSFANYNSVPCGGIARLNASTNSPGYQGTVDPYFNVGQGVTGSNAIVHVLAVQQGNGQVILGGDFTAFNSVAYNHLIRLNIDGSVDTSFNPSTNFGPADSVRAIAIQPDGQILIGGLFTNVGGSNLNYLARLNSADGSVDTNFNVGVGGNNTVLALAVDSQERILVGGDFTRFSGVTRSGITRLNPDGTVDPTINFGSGADGGFVDAIVIQSNDEIDVGGGFSTFEGIAENNFVRLYGGANYGDGLFEFAQGVYGVLENGTNAVITVQRLGGEGTNAQTTVSVVFSTSNGTALAGTNYTGVTTNLIFPLGESFETVTIPIINGTQVGGNTIVNLNLSDPTPASTGLGPQASAILVITNVNTAVNFAAQTYNQSENAPGSNAIIAVVRIGNPNNTVGVTVYTGTNGTATPNVDYTPTTNFLVFNPGVMTNYFLVPVLGATNMFGSQTVDLEMSNPSNTFLGSPSSATLYLNSVNNGPGVLSFSQPSYSIVAPGTGVTNEVITIVRTDGSLSNVDVTFTTSNGTAVAGIEYASIQTNVVFPDDTFTETVSIPVYAQPDAGPATTVYMTLSNPQNGATIGGAAQEILTILNGIEGFSFTNSPYTVGEGAGTVTLQIARNGPMANAASVSYNTFTPPSTTEAEGYAQPNVDYVPASGTLNFAANETFTTIPITIIQENAVNGPLTFQVVLNNPSPAGVQIGSPGTALVTIESDVTGFEFSTNSYSVGENGSNIIITVNRLNSYTGAASVQYATSNGTNVLNPILNASNQVDYDSVSGTLTFQTNQASASFTVPIINQNIVEGNKTFNMTLSNPLVTQSSSSYTNAYLVSPSNAAVTITNVLAGVSFGSPTYTVSECGVTAAIPVVLTGSTNYPVTVNFSTTNGGSAVPGLTGNYLATNGTLTFSNGQTVQTFYVEVLNNHIIGPNHTVFLTLSSPSSQGNVQLLNPSTAVLTIDECNGAYIVSSGTAFVSGSVSNSGGVIFPNETVTILFGLRDIAGSNTTDLVATLLATNGVTNVSGPQTYGVLITNGPTVARSFTFEAVGANGQNISANLALQDGSQVYSNVDFGFTLGNSSITFSTNEILLLTGTSPAPSKAYNTNPPNDGYPSVINVSGVVGTVTAIIAGISNFGHTYPSDVAMVLESPSGQDTFLMADCGGTNSVGHLNFTFSQSAGSSLPQSSALASGAYLPTAYGATEALPTNGAGLPQAPLPPFQTNLSTFVGQPPNGTWSLFVADDETLDNGYISNGWSLTISTGIPVASDSDLELAITAAPATITVGATLVYSISVTNYGPAVATNVIITDTLPSGVYYSNILVGANGMVLTNAVGTLAVSNGVTFNVTVVPNALGYITNIAAATASQPDPNVNNVQTNVVLVSAPSADMGVTLGSSPNPVLDGANVTYTIVVTNNGPSTATGVMATNVLPAGFILLTNQTVLTQGAITNVNGTITWNVGTNVANSSATLTIVAGVSLPENGLPSSANLDSVTVGSSVYDPTKLNNFASVKTEVEPAMLTVTPNGTSYALSWQQVAGNIVLEGAVTLSGPWVPIANPAAVNGIYTYVLPGTNGYHFFILKSQLP